MSLENKFVTQNEQGSQKAPMETMTKGRVYALIDRNKNAPKSIIYFDKENKRNKQIDLDHVHRGISPHAQILAKLSPLILSTNSLKISTTYFVFWA